MDYPRIRVISGPREGLLVFIEEDDEITIGRSKSCDLVLDDPSVALRHCYITRVVDYVQVADLISGFRIYVNGFYYPGKALVHADRIRVGNTMIVYLTRPDQEVDPAMLKLTPAERAWEWESEPGTHGYEAPKAVVIETLLQIGASINGLRDVDEIQSRVFEWLFRVIPIESAAIQLFDRGSDGVAITTYRHAGSPSGEAFPIDESVMQEAVSEGGLVCGGNWKCVGYPLTALGTPVGLIYLVMSKAGSEHFTKAHAQLIESIAGSAAVALENARTVAWLESENRRLKESIAAEHGMVGRSPRMQVVYELVGGAAPSDLTILITGESGTGKELVARAIHRNSPRSAKDFQAVNCSAFTETLLGSELFGHERGAFTGADRLRKGLFESAEGGTVFLDEIGDCPPTMQADLLRLLQNKEFKRIGGNHTLHANVRIIAATNIDLQKAIRDGKFRADLFYRLNVIAIHMPGLAERREDIPALTAHFIGKYGQLRPPSQPPILGVTPEAQYLLSSYVWPGNVRELEHAILRAVTLGKSPYIGPQDLPEAIAGASEPARIGRWETEIDAAKKKILERAMKETGGSRAEAARLLDLHPTYFASLCKQFNVKWPLQ